MTVTLHFEIGDLWVEGEVLGTTISTDYRGYPCTFTFPSHRGDFGLEQSRQAEMDAIGGFWGEREAPTRAAVRMVRVTVEMPGDLLAADMPPIVTPRPEVMDEAEQIMRQAGDVASSLVASVVAWARVDSDQFWLEPAHSSPRVTWTSSLRDRHGDRLAMGYPTHLVMHGISMEQQVLDTAALRRIAESARAGAAPSTAETLLADARFYAWRASEPNPRLGLLLAAIACEVRIKAYLTGAASKKQASLVELILDSPRDVSMAASSLFDKGLKAVTGVSMKERDRDLWKAVDLLFRHRNRVAHRGDTALSGSELTTDIQAAAGAFLFLRDLETTPPRVDQR